MNEIEDRLTAAVRAEAGFGVDDVGARVIRRRRRRRVVSGIAAVVVVVGIGVGIAALSGDDGPDLDVAGDDGGDDGGDGGTGGDGGDGPGADSAPVDEVLEDPIGADGTAGATTTDHLVAESPFPRCDDIARDGPAEGERYVAQTAMWEAFRAQFSPAEWPYVTGFGGPESIWGMPSVDLTRPDRDTFDRLLEFFDPGEMCVGLPPEGAVPPVPVDVPWELVSVGDDDTTVTVVELTDCAMKAGHIETWVLDHDDRVEVGIQAWSEANVAFPENCPPPAEYTVELPTPVAGRPVVVATTRPLEIDDPVAAGATTTFTVAEHNRAGIDVIGDDMLARLVDDPTVRFQVSDVFGDVPLAGRPRAVVRDQHPMTGSGTIRVPADVPTGTYTIQFLDRPELNGTLEVVPAASGGGDEVADSPSGVLVADGEMSDIHVEAVDIPLPECTEAQFFGSDETDPRLVELRDALMAEGLTDQPFLSGTGVSDVLQVDLNRRYGPTIEWIAQRVDRADVCLFFWPPIGAFTSPAPRLDWVVATASPDSPEATIRLDRDCGLLGSAPLEPVVQEEGDLVVVRWAASAFFGPTGSPCLPPDEATLTLDAPLGDRPLVAGADPEPVEVTAGEIVVVDVGRLASAATEGLGDDVMIQSVDDPSRQIQVTDVWGDPSAGGPAPIVTDRYAPADRAALLVPAGTPPGDYTWAFIEHPQLSGALTVVDAG